MVVGVRAWARDRQEYAWLRGFMAAHFDLEEVLRRPVDLLEGLLA